MATTKKKAAPVAKKAATSKKAPAKAAKKAVAKPAAKAVTKKAPAKKAASKPAIAKAVAKKSPVKKPVAKVTTKKAEAKKPAPKKAVVKKAAPQKVAKPAAKNAAKPIVKKFAPKIADKKTSKELNTKKTAPKKETKVKAAPAKKEAPKKVVSKVAEKPAAKQKDASHQELLKKAVKAKKVEEKKKAQKEKTFVMPTTQTDKARKYNPNFTKSILDQPEEVHTGPTMRYSDNELKEFRDLITRKLESAKKELAYLQGLITRKDQMGGDESDNRYMTMEDGSLSMEREQLSQMASRQITFIDHLEKAIMRIENKTYGICRVTGKLIDKARLRAVPHATLSIEAKMGIAK